MVAWKWKWKWKGNSNWELLSYKNNSEAYRVVQNRVTHILKLFATYSRMRRKSPGRKDHKSVQLTSKNMRDRLGA
jgi:hypothetical protein